MSSGPSVLVRRAEPSDWASIWPFWSEIVSAGDTYTYDPSTDFDGGRATWMEGDGVECWVAELDGRVVGTYEISPNHAGPGSHIANGSYMVDASVRGQGVGRALVRHSLARTADLGYRAMQFNAVAASNVGAIGLYESLGFTTIGVVPDGFHHPHDGYVGLLIMYRSLDVA